MKKMQRFSGKNGKVWAKILAFFKKLFTGKRKKPVVLGIAFGSGGAKGMAHLGALKAFEEEGIEFSVVTGTSIGSITGALYAKGYSSADMAMILQTLNRKEFSKNLRPYADPVFIENFLQNYLDGDFASLKKPFACCVTESAQNSCVVLKRGKLARALTASSAIPPFFRGVDIGDKRYYDGAFSNAVPTDICKEMGAEYVVGIDLSAFVKPYEEKGRFSKLFGNAVEKLSPVKKTADCLSRGYESANFMLRPNLKGFHATDVSREAMDEMFERGYEEAKRNIPQIKAEIEKLK